MATRRQSREWAVQFLFQHDFNPEVVERALDDFWREKKTDDKSRRFAEELIRGVLEHRPEIDAKLKQYAEHWDLARMNAVDRNVMRVAMFEMLFRRDIPPVVSINEAVDVARAFGTAESGKFVNGLLDCARKEIDRPSRQALA